MDLPCELVLAVAAWLPDEDVLRLRLVRAPPPPRSTPASTLRPLPVLRRSVAGCAK